MLEEVSVGSFVAVATALLVTPGPAVAFVLARSLEGGRTAGLVSQLGLCAGLLVHVVGATLGLSAVIASSAWMFSILKYLGAAYLLWLGVRTLLARDRAARGSSPGSPTRPSRRRMFVDGFLIDALNPKPALFFLALLPQFVDPGAGEAAWQIAGLGLLFVLLALVTGSGYALAAGTLAGELEASPHLRRVSRWASGSVYLMLGGLAAFVKR